MLSVELLRPVLLRVWGPDTCDPHDLAGWRPENPARGQCGTTALVVQDLLGGELVMGEMHRDGAKVGFHWWNRLPDGTAADLTAEQFHPGETVVGGEVRHRPPHAPGRCRGQYELLRRRVLHTLSADHPHLALGHDAADVPPAAQLAVVALTDPAGAVLLEQRGPSAPTEPGQWALPGWPVEPGRSPAEVAAHGLAAVTGLTVPLRPMWRVHHAHAFTGTCAHTVTLGNGQAATFVPVEQLAHIDLGPTAAAVLHRLLYGSGWRVTAGRV